MKRKLIVPRADWETRVQEQGLTYYKHSDPKQYWRDDVYYEFDSKEIEIIEKVSAELYSMLVDTAQIIMDKPDLLKELNFNDRTIAYIRNSWDTDEKSLYGRFDFAYNPSLDCNPKLLEFNGDTPTSLIEAAVIQWNWLQEQNIGKDQFNSIHDKLIKSWEYYPNDLLFCTATDSEEELQTLAYLAETAYLAGKNAEVTDMTNIGWNYVVNQFEGKKIENPKAIFKLYPWELMFNESFGVNLSKSKQLWIEPAWKIVISNKLILPMLWKLYPDHPNLLPASKINEFNQYVKKFPFSREGSNITLKTDTEEIKTVGEYNIGLPIYQQYFELPNFGNNYPVIGSWIIGGEPAGMGIRECASKITNNLSQFIPHIIAD